MSENKTFQQVIEWWREREHDARIAAKVDPEFGSASAARCVAIKQCADEASLVLERLRALDLGERIASLIEQHETSYMRLAADRWEWKCACGEKAEFLEREFCVRITRGHWANVINKAVKDALEQIIGP